MTLNNFIRRSWFNILIDLLKGWFHIILFIFFITGMESILIIIFDRLVYFPDLLKQLPMVIILYISILSVPGILFYELIKVMSHKFQFNNLIKDRLIHLFWFLSFIVLILSIGFYLNKRIAFYGKRDILYDNLIFLLIIGVFALIQVFESRRRYGKSRKDFLVFNYSMIVSFNFFLIMISLENQYVLSNNLISILKLLTWESLFKNFLIIIGSVSIYFIFYNLLLRLIFKWDKKKKKAVSIGGVIIMILVGILLFSSGQGKKLNLTRNKSELDQKHTNVVIVLLDALRKGHLGCYGYDKVLAPNIDLFCEQAVKFNLAYTQAPQTPEAIKSLFSSLYPTMFNVYQFLPDKVKTMAESLKDAGYITAAFTSNPYVSPNFNFHQGFDQFSSSADIPQFLIIPIMKGLVIKFPKIIYKLGLVDGGFFYEEMEGLNRKLFQFLTKVKGRKFFIYHHVNDIHGPYLPPKKYLGEYDYSSFVSYWDLELRVKGKNPLSPKELKNLINRYDAQIKYVDDQFGLLLERMKEEGVYNNTLIVVLADHGEEFQEHGKFGHGHSMYEELLNIPLIIKMPENLVKIHKSKIKKEIDIISMIVDIYPTVMDFCHIQYDSEEIVGKSLRPLLLGFENGDKDRMLYSSYPSHSSRVIRQGDWKLIEERGKKSLYNLEKDPEETVDLLAINKDVASKFDELLNRMRMLDKEKRMEGKSNIKLKQKTLERLKSLGYVQSQ